MSILRKATDTYPAPALVGLLGALLEIQGDGTGAEQAFALARAGEDLAAAEGSVVDLEVAVFEANRGNHERALDAARRAYTARQTVFTADALGWALTRAGRAGEALPFVEEALRLGIQSPAVRFHAAAAYAQAGQPDRAREELARVLATNPRFDPSVYTEVTELAAALGVATPTRGR